MAEKEGFEPSIPFWGIHDFQSCALGQLRDFSNCAAFGQPGYNTTISIICQYPILQKVAGKSAAAGTDAYIRPGGKQGTSHRFLAVSLSTGQHINGQTGFHTTGNRTPSFPEAAGGSPALQYDRHALRGSGRPPGSWTGGGQR